MLGPLTFTAFTLVHAAIALCALLAFAELPYAAVCLFIVEAVTAFDNAVTVAGNRLGIAPRTVVLNRLRFLLHATCIGLLLPVYAHIGVALAFPHGLAGLVNALAWVLAAVLVVYGYFAQYRGMSSMMPVNYYGCLRYAQAVSERTRHPDYPYSATELAARGKLPVVSIVTTLIGLVLATLIGWFGSFWVPFIVTAMMLLAGGMPLRSWGPFATSCLEIVFSAGMLYSLLVAAGLLHSAG
jgi:hypothetical protein